MQAQSSTEGKKQTDSTVEKLLGQLVTHFTARSYKQNPTHGDPDKEKYAALIYFLPAFQKSSIPTLYSCILDYGLLLVEENRRQTSSLK